MMSVQPGRGVAHSESEEAKEDCLLCKVDTLSVRKVTFQDTSNIDIKRGGKGKVMFNWQALVVCAKSYATVQGII